MAARDEPPLLFLKAEEEDEDEIAHDAAHNSLHHVADSSSEEEGGNDARYRRRQNVPYPPKYIYIYIAHLSFFRIFTVNKYCKSELLCSDCCSDLQNGCKLIVHLVRWGREEIFFSVINRKTLWTF
jgi:hypothetical protein